MDNLKIIINKSVMQKEVDKMNKLIIKILTSIFILYSSNVFASDTASKEICKESFQSVAEHHIDIENKFDNNFRSNSNRLFLDLAISCSDNLLVDNLVNNILYQALGEPYRIAFNVSVIPYKQLIKMYQKFDTNSSTIEIPELKLIKDNGSRTLFFGGTINSIIKNTVLIINYILIGICCVVLIKIAFKNQKGDFTKENVKNIKRFIFGIGLIAPLPFLEHYSIIQFLILFLVALGSMIANSLYFLVYFSTYAMDVANYIPNKDIVKNNYNEETIFLSNEEYYRNNFNFLVDANLCMINTLEKDLEFNIADTTAINDNYQYNWVTEIEKRNFFNCMSSNIEYKEPSFYNKNLLDKHNKHEFCRINYPFYYDKEEKLSLKLNELNCGKFNNDNTMTSFKQDFENSTFTIAQKMHRYNCIKDVENNHLKINRTFRCVEFTDYAGFKLEYVEDIKKYDVINIPFGNYTEQGLFIELMEIKKHAMLVFLGLLNEIVKMVNSSLGNEELTKNELYIFKYKENLLISNLKNGWLGSFSIFLPRKEFNNQFSITNHTKEYIKSKINVRNKSELFIRNPEEYIDMTSDFMSKFQTQELISLANKIKEMEYIPNNSNENTLFTNDLSYKDISDINNSISEDNKIKNYKISIMDILEKDLKKVTEKCIYERKCAVTHSNPVTYFYLLGSNMLEKGIMVYTAISIKEFILVDLMNKKHSAALLDNIKSLSFIFIAVGVFSSFFIAIIPFLRFSVIAINWLYKTLKTILSINLVALYIIIPDENSEEITSNNQIESTLYKMLLQSLLVPSFLVLGVLVAYMVLYIIVTIINNTLFLAFSVFGSGNNIVLTILELIIMVSVYFTIIGIAIVVCSKKIHETVIYLNENLNLNIQNDRVEEFDRIIGLLTRRIFLFK